MVDAPPEPEPGPESKQRAPAEYKPEWRSYLTELRAKKVALAVRGSIVMQALRGRLLHRSKMGRTAHVERGNVM